MTVIATEFLSSTGIAAATTAAGHLVLTPHVKREIERLTESLFFNERGLRYRSVLFAEVGSDKTSSLWLAAGVASVLGEILGQTVHLVSIAVNASDAVGAGEQPDVGSAMDNYDLEQIVDEHRKQSNASVLRDRLLELQTRGGPVIVHLPQLRERMSLLAGAPSLEGVVLLIRAGQTRRAAVEAIERNLATKRIPILGSVLLDRVHPIPEKLYRIL